MKQIKFLAFALFAVAITNAQVGIGTTSPDASAVLELKTSDKGLLIPRLTTTEITAITSPAEGLIVYNVTEKCIQVNVGDAITRDFECLGAGDGGTTNAPTSGAKKVCTPFETEVVPLTSPTTGRIWMDRNLGASRAATAFFDTEEAMGFLFQWGRAADCHQYRDTGVEPIRLDYHNTTDAAGSSNFIINTNSDTRWTNIPYSQLEPLWTASGTGGPNNPCPTGYRVPSIAEWRAEVSTTAVDISGDSSGGTASSGGITSPLSGFSLLKLNATGRRRITTTSTVDNQPLIDFDFIYQPGAGAGQYWSTTPNAANTNPTNVSPRFVAFTLIVNNGSDYITTVFDQAAFTGNPIRCIKN